LRQFAHSSGAPWQRRPEQVFELGEDCPIEFSRVTVLADTQSSRQLFRLMKKGQPVWLTL